jgi:hypothetical protein
VIDSRWLCELLELGLVRPSFVRACAFFRVSVGG